MNIWGGDAVANRPDTANISVGFQGVAFVPINERIIDNRCRAEEGDRADFGPARVDLRNQ